MHAWIQRICTDQNLGRLHNTISVWQLLSVSSELLTVFLRFWESTLQTHTDIPLGREWSVIMCQTNLSRTHQLAIAEGISININLGGPTNIINSKYEFKWSGPQNRRLWSCAAQLFSRLTRVSFNTASQTKNFISKEKCTGKTLRPWGCL